MNSVKFSNTFNEAKEIAISIFEEYLKNDARYYVRLEPVIRDDIYKKFGYVEPR